MLTTYEKFYNNWPTTAGAWFAGERVVVNGRDLFSDLKDFTWLKMFMFQVTGREYDDDHVRVFEFYYANCGSFPDPRLWNNRVAALAGTTRSLPSLALSGGTATSGGKTFGQHPAFMALHFAQRGLKKFENGESLENIILDEKNQGRNIYGFGRPIVNGDERIPPMLELLKELGFDKGTHMNFMLKVDEYFIEQQKPLRMNIIGLMSGVFADFGFSPQEYCQVSSIVFSVGIIACYKDATTKPVGALFPLKCSSLEFIGEKQCKKWGQ